MIFDHAGNEVGRSQLEHEQIMPRAGWVEHDPMEIWHRTDRGHPVSALRGRRLTGQDLAAVGITNQRETTVVWNRRTGMPYDNAIVWQDTRTDRIASALDHDGRGDVDPAQVRAPARDVLLRRQAALAAGQRRRPAGRRRARARRSSAPSTPG